VKTPYQSHCSFDVCSETCLCFFRECFKHLIEDGKHPILQLRLFGNFDLQRIYYLVHLCLPQHIIVPLTEVVSWEKKKKKD